jgi:hypothetical protein
MFLDLFQSLAYDNNSACFNARYIKVKVEHYLLFLYSPPKISWFVSGIKYIVYIYFLFSI